MPKTTTTELTIRQQNAAKRQLEYTATVRAFYAAHAAGDTKAADAILAKVSPGTAKNLKAGLAAKATAKPRGPKQDPMVLAERTKSFFAAVRGNDHAGVVKMFGEMSAKAQAGTLTTLGKMVEAGRVTPTMATTVGKLSAAA